MKNSKLDITFNGVSLKSEGYSVEDILLLLKSLCPIREIDTPLDKCKDTNCTVCDDLKGKSIEEINLKELGKTIRMPKTTNNFRCPNCGQALIVFYLPSSGENVLLVRDILSGGVAVYKANIVSLPKIKDMDNFISVYKELLNLLGEKVVLVESSKDMCNCPYCLEEKPISEWINAYNNPLDIFEMSDICDVCGSEGSIVVTQNGEYVSCENNCMKKLEDIKID